MAQRGADTHLTQICSHPRTGVHTTVGRRQPVTGRCTWGRRSGERGNCPSASVPPCPAPGSRASGQVPVQPPHARTGCREAPRRTHNEPRCEFKKEFAARRGAEHASQGPGPAAEPHLDPREHDGDQVVIGEEEGSHHAAVPHVLYDGCGAKAERLMLLRRGSAGGAEPEPALGGETVPGTAPKQRGAGSRPPSSRGWRTGATCRHRAGASLPLTGFWCMESTKCRGFSMVYLRSRMVWEPVPSLHIPFLALLACSSSSASLLCSGLQGRDETG